MLTKFRYTVGGTLPENDSTYVERSADQDLLNFAKNTKLGNRVCFVLAPRQMGKSSLKQRTISKLEKQKIACASISLQPISDKESNFKEKFWRGLIDDICRELPHGENLLIKLNQFWRKNSNDYFPNYCFKTFLLDELLPNLKQKKLVIFIDEVQALIKCNLQDEFIETIRNLSDNVKNNILQRVSFVLIGVAKLSEFSQDSNLNIGENTELTYLSGECYPLQEGLKAITKYPSKILKRVFYWTNGQPFLTQLVCYLLVENKSIYIDNYSWEDVDHLVKEKIIDSWIQERREEKRHFQEIQKLFLTYDPDKVNYKLQLLNYYETKIYQKDLVKWQDGYNIHADLLMSGLVIKTRVENIIYLQVANPIYEQIFNYEWIDEMRQRLVTGNVIPEDDWPEIDSNLENLDDFKLIQIGFQILEKGLKPFVESRMNQALGNSWKNLPEIRSIIRPPGDNSPLTTINYQKLLKLILANWETVFHKSLNIRHKIEIEALLEIADFLSLDFDLTQDQLTPKILTTMAYILSITGYDSEAKQIDELRMNQYPEWMNPTTINVTENTLGCKQLQMILSQGETFMALTALLEKPTLTVPDTMVKDTMDRSNRISKIIETRQPRGKKVADLIDKLQSLISQIDTMDSTRNRFLVSLDEVSVIEKLRDLNFEQYKQKIREVNKVLTKLQKRFSRQNLSIALVGRAGQGKSLLIQTLTGLTDTEVPSGTMNNCTGVRVIIAHSNDEKASGEVYFHNEESFLKENIYPYYDFLNLGTKPATFNDFVHSPLPDLKIDTSEAKALYEHLEKCYDHHQDYSHLLKEKSPKSISKQEIRKYVAQTDNNDQRTFFNYLAVEEVKIFCKFPHKDVGQIALIDLPGLGDTVLGDRERLRKSLGEDVDFALFINMPQGTRILQEEEYKLFDIANAALPELPIKKWSMMVLNEIKNPQPGLAKNRAYCEEMKRRLETERRIEVTQCVIANCSDQGEAADVLNQVLYYLEHHIFDLDTEYASIANNDLKQLKNDLNILVEKARQAFAISPKYSSEIVLFRDLVNKLMDEIGFQLPQLIKQLRPENLAAEHNKKDVDFWQEIINDIVQRGREDTGIPTKEEIYRMYFKLGPVGGWGGVFRRCLDVMRTHFRQHFSSIDNGLQEYVQQIKTRIADVFTDTDLGNLTTARGVEFLEFMVEEIPPYFSNLQQSFETLLAFEMSYRSNFQYRILKALQQLDPDESGDTFDPKGKTEEEIVELIHEILVVFHRNTLCNCQLALENLEGEPSLAAYAAADEFVDKVHNSTNAKEEWEDFMRERSSLIWTNKFGENVGQEQQEWNQLIENVISLNKLENI
jgi:energy-coupling factor transporter ATP-binding protein EcfA2